MMAYSYGTFASSALAGQSLSRTSYHLRFTNIWTLIHDVPSGNIMGTIFPLFTQQLYGRLTYHWGTSLFGLIAAVMIPIPFVRRMPTYFCVGLLIYLFCRFCIGKDHLSVLIASSHRRWYINNAPRVALYHLIMNLHQTLLHTLNIDLTYHILV